VTSTFSQSCSTLCQLAEESGPHALADLRRKLQEERAIFIIFRMVDEVAIVDDAFQHGLGMLIAEQTCGCACGSLELLGLPTRKLPRPASIKLMIG